MYQTILKESDVKIFTDKKGIKKEVLITYKKFQEILDFIERQSYFDSEEAQERIKKSEEDLKEGRYIKVKASEIDKALEWLNE
ncbi:MAG: hypothetical protein ACE5KT_04130 [Methanosarcinales archaeon]